MKRLVCSLVLTLPLAACSDSTAPTWPDSAELELSVDENAIVAKWPGATDDKGVTSYTVSVDGSPAAESGADARNFKAMSAPMGADHEFSVVARDAAGNASEPLTAKWAAKDMQGPEWPVGKTLLVSKQDPDAEAVEGETLDLVITWPEATDDDAVEFYRVLQVPSSMEGDVRPKLVGLVKADVKEVKAKGTPKTKFQVYAVDKSENSSKPLLGALDNPTRLDPTKNIRLLDKSETAGAGETPKVNKNAAKDAMGQ